MTSTFKNEGRGMITDNYKAELKGKLEPIPAAMYRNEDVDPTKNRAIVHDFPHEHLNEAEA